MKDETFCPYCDQLVMFEFSSDYYMSPEGNEFEQIQCPRCNSMVSVSWENSHSFNFNRVKK